MPTENLDNLTIMASQLVNQVRRSQEQYRTLLGHLQAIRALCSETVAKSDEYSNSLRFLENLSTDLRAVCSKLATAAASSICDTSMPSGEMKGSASSTDGKSDLHYVPVSKPSTPAAAQDAISSTAARPGTNGSKSPHQRMRVELSSVAKKVRLSPRQRKLIEKSMRKKGRRAARKSLMGTTTR